MANHLHVTPSFISQLERGISSPTISLLKEISEFFGVPVASLLESSEDGIKNYPIRKKDERKTLVTERGTKFQLLSHSYDLNCEFVLNEWAPGGSTGTDKYSHEGFECGFVLRGKLRVELGDKVYLLSSGDSITFRSSIPHLIHNPSKKTTIAVWVNSVPWLFQNR